MGANNSGTSGSSPEQPPGQTAEPNQPALSRRRLLQWLLAAGGGAALGCRTGGRGSPQAGAGAAPGRAQRRPRRPNIVFIFSDDHAINAISAYGSRINHTPHIDRLAADGVLFEHCCCANAICAPSRATVLTGTHSHVNGVRDNRSRFDPRQTAFPQLLQAAGYQTALIGKWHMKSDPVGFDHWEVLQGQGAYYNPTFRTPTGRRRYTGYVTDITTQRALDWLENARAADQPFALLLQHKAPHRPWMPGPKYLHLYDGVEIPEPPTLFDDYSGRASAARLQKMSIARDLYEGYDLKVSDEYLTSPDQRGPTFPFKWLNDEQRAMWDAAYEPRNRRFARRRPQGRDYVRWRYQRYIKDYLRCVASVDDSVGAVLDYLDRHGLRDDTVVIYASDQGFYLGEHGWFDKRFMYEESLHMPLIVRWPQVTAPGRRVTALVQNIDFAPTFLELAGVSVPQRMQGRSLLPLLTGEVPRDWRKSIYYRYYEYPSEHAVLPHYGVRTERYKLICYHTVGEWELFDLHEDPRELHSVYDEPAYADVRRALQAELERLRRLCGDETG